MQKKPRFLKHSLVTVSTLFLTSVAVLSVAGQSTVSGPAAPVSLVSAEASSFSSSVAAPAYAASNQFYPGTSTESNDELEARAQEVKTLYSSNAAQNSAVEKSDAQWTRSDALALAGGNDDATKTVASVETPAAYRYVNANELNVRSGAGTSFEKIATLKRKEKVGVISVNGDWARIQTTSGTTGYTLSEYLVSKESDVDPEEPAAYWYVNADTLNVRSAAGTDSDKVATLSRGDKVGYFTKNGDWARIQTSSGKTGYVLAKYMVDKKSSVASVSEDASVSRGSADYGDVSELAQQICDYSTQFQGVKYVYGGSTTKGFDCSGFVKYVYAHFGINVPRSSEEYASFGVKVSRDNLRPSDILLFDTNNNGAWDVGHVGIYLGGDKFIHASTSKGKVIIMTLSQYPADYYGAIRVIK